MQAWIIILVLFVSIFPAVAPAEAQATDFSLSISPSSTTVNPGGTVVYTITASPIAGVWDRDAGCVWVDEAYVVGFLWKELFSRGTQDIICGYPFFTATKSLDIASTARPGTYTIMFAGYTSLGLRHEIAVTLVVEAAAQTPAPIPSPTQTPTVPETTPGGTPSIKAGEKYTSLTYKGTITVDVSSGARDSGVAQYTLSATVSVPFEITLTPSRPGARDLTGKTKRFTVPHSGAYSYSKSSDYCRSIGQSGSGSLSGTLELYVEGRYHGDTNEVTLDIGELTGSTESPDPGICRNTGGLYLGGIGALGDISGYYTNQLKFKATGGSVPLSGPLSGIGTLSVWAPRSSYSGNAELTLVSYEVEKPVEAIPREEERAAPIPAPSMFDYEVIVFPQSQAIEQGEKAEYAVTVKLTDGEPLPVTLTLTTDPRISHAFFPGSNPPTFNSQLNIRTSCDTPPTLYALQILGESAAYRLTKFDVVTLQVNPNPECAESVGSVTKGQAGWDTGSEGFVEQPLGKRGRVIIGPKSQVRWFPTSEGTGFSVIKGKVHLTYKAEAAETPPGYEISASEIRGGGLPIGGIGITYGEYTAAIRGTEFLLEVADDGTGTLTVLEGTVEVWKTQEPERAVFVKDGQQLVTRPNEPLPEPISADPNTISALPQSDVSISEIASATGTWWTKPPKSASINFVKTIVGLLVILILVLALAAWINRRRRKQAAPRPPEMTPPPSP